MVDDDLTSDILHGMKAICRFLNIKERQGYELAETGKLPLFKLGDRKWQGRKSTLLRHVERLEAQRDGERRDMNTDNYRQLARALIDVCSWSIDERRARNTVR